ncbi:MAG TPA: phosphotransferase [Herpetosiphonaceae bacterium]
MTNRQPLSHVLRQFDLTAEPAALPGGTTTTFRVGDVVLKQIQETSLENNHSAQLIQWIADLSTRVEAAGFRLPQPVPTVDGAWITADGWTAWSFLEGRHAAPADIPACIQGILALHRALKPIPKHPLMDDNRTPWGRAHRWCWAEQPDHVQPQLRPLLDRLYALRRPIHGLEWQLMHGDLNPENILIAPGVPPAFLDFSPFWGPPEFALAIFANWIGPRRGDASVLAYFEDVPAFDQLLIRAGIRMLLVMAAIDKLEDWATCFERRAAEMIVAYVMGIGEHANRR